MTCPKCNAPIDAEMQSCTKCGAAVAVSQETPTPKRKRYWTLGRLLFWIFLCGIVSASLFPANPPGPRQLKANMAAVAARGKDIYFAITTANKEREPLGLPPIWPKTSLASTNYPSDISGKTFKISTAYFGTIMSQNSEGTTNGALFVNGLDYSKLAGAGVPCCPPGQKLAAKNNMWLIAANVTPEDSDLIPVLITRNVDVRAIERAINYGIKTNDFKTKIALGEGEYKTPFGNKGLVLVRKGGGAFNNSAKYATLGILFNGQEFPPRDLSKPPIVYLMP